MMHLLAVGASNIVARAPALGARGPAGPNIVARAPAMEAREPAVQRTTRWLVKRAMQGLSRCKGKGAMHSRVVAQQFVEDPCKMAS
ncbi:hypothetical protein U724_02140 [Pseudomonas chlororaphis subsp. aurantiaca PB-St2]|nr:hypothetical protein U724_02140 [Pseudomonas chlororaphis subsp. aurantiaca PB-St2]